VPTNVVVAVSGVRAAGITVTCCCADKLVAPFDGVATVARRYASD